MVEQTLRTYGVAKPSNTMNQALTIDFEGRAPNGYVLSGIELAAWISVTTNPTNATLMHKVFKNIKVQNEAGPVAEIRNGDALPMTCAISQALKQTQVYSTTPRSTDIVRNPSISVAGTDYYGNYKLHTPLPGNNFLCAVQLEAPGDSLAGITAIASSYAATFVWQRSAPEMQQYVMVSDYNALTNVRYNNIARGGVYAADSFRDDASAVVFGDDLSTTVLRQAENDFNDQLRGLLASNNSVGDTDVNTVDDPATGNPVYGVLGSIDPAGPVSLAMKQQETVGTVLFTTGGRPSDVAPQVGSQ